MNYIYTLSDGNEVRYVGKTKNLNKRYYSHIYESSLKKTHKEKWINKTLLEGGKIIIEILDICDESDSDFFEKFWIFQLKSWGFNLTNLTEGGEGGSPMKGRKMTEEQKNKMSEIAIKNNNSKKIAGWNKGLKMSDDFKMKISKSSLGRKVSEETKKKISDKSKGIKKGPMSDETKNKISKKKKGLVSPNKGKKYNDEVKKRMSLSKLGVKKSDDVKKIYSECKKIIWKIKNPEGQILDFFGYDEFKQYVEINSLSVSVSTLKSYGKNKGWEVIDKIKQK